MKYLIVLMLNLSACATTRVVSIGPDTYFIQREGGSGFSSTGSLKMEAIEGAGKHCASLGKELAIVSVSTSGGGMDYPSSDVQFRCLSKNDPELTRPTLTPAANTVIEVRK